MFTLSKSRYEDSEPASDEGEEEDEDEEELDKADGKEEVEDEKEEEGIPFDICLLFYRAQPRS